MEQELIRWLENQFSETNNKNVLLGIGDDGAILKASSDHQVLVADAIIDKVHFDVEQHDLESIGHKALAVNLSDIAAMGAIPQTALVSIVLPREFSFDEVKRLFSGISKLASKSEVAIVGGDTCRHDGPLMVSVTATGTIDSNAKCPEGWRMDGAQPGDILVVTGPLGGSILGSHLNFAPATQVAEAIQRLVRVNAATDLSDSLAVDLGHVLRKSGVGARLNLKQFPVSAEALTLAKTSGKTAIEHALYDGEDFQLLLSLSKDCHRSLSSQSEFAFELHVIGECTSSHPCEIFDDATGEEIEIRGYEH